MTPDAAPIVAHTDEARLRGLLASRIAEHFEELAIRLDSKLRRARVVAAAKIPSSIVTMNSRVACWSARTGARHELSLVYPWDAGGLERVSIFSRLGVELLAATPHQVISLHGMRLVIQHVSYQPEADRQFHL